MVLSIVIPVYNTASYLEGCLASVLAGDCTDCEILLVDDGSTDGVSPELCDRLAEAHPDLVQVIHQENCGLGGARNTGLEAARGEYLFFLDSDDTIASHALTTLKQAIQNTGAEIIAFHFLTDDGTGHRIPNCANAVQRDTPFTAEQEPEFLLSIPSACCRIWRRGLFLSSGIRFPSRVWYEDLRTTMKLFVLAKSIFTLPDPLYHYLQRPGSIMRSGNVDRNREILEQKLLNVYYPILCRLCMDHVYLAASVRVLTVDPQHPLLWEFGHYLKHHFPDYKSNPYLPHLSRSKKMVFHLLEGHHYHLLRFLFRTKNRLA